MFRRLTAVTENILISPVKYGSIAVSLARAVLSIIQHWQAQVQKSYFPRTQGVLALQAQFVSIDDPLRELGKLCRCVLSFSTQTDEEFPVTESENGSDAIISRRIVIADIPIGIEI